MAVDRAYIIGEIVNGMLANLGVTPSAEQLAAIVNTAESIANPIADEIESYIGGGGGLNWRGAYSGLAVYQVDDVVYYNGSSYVCIQASTGNLPTNATYWELLALAGQDGDDGVSPNLTIGTVTTGAAGSPASASITGTLPDLELNLTIPTGSDGDDGAPGAGATSFEYTASGAASLDITIPPGYRKIEIEISGIYPSTNNTSLWLRVATGDPAVYRSGAGNYTWYRAAGLVGAGFGGVSNASDTKIDIVGAASVNSSSRGYNGTIWLIQPDDTTYYKFLQFKIAGWVNTNVLYTTEGSGAFINTLDGITGVRILASSGNINGKAVIRLWE